MRVETAAVAMPSQSPRSSHVDGRRLFAWHHPPAGRLPRRWAVVLCPPLGYEHMSAYRTWRILAERLGFAPDFDVLRLDYHGTGNSEGDAGEAHDASTAGFEASTRPLPKPGAWLDVSQVALVGLRAGAIAGAAGRASQQAASSGWCCGVPSPPDVPTCASSAPWRG